ncbi:hypothetical protein Tco_0861413 [Tanacetum coccineum]|uniref:Uncharacterized protein n=1 Tax=Tanacetum coccineum TaxID=301880 RepID=A0ABQ5BL29_9ASTR
MIDFMKHDIFKEQQILCDCDKSTKLQQGLDGCSMVQYCSLSRLRLMFSWLRGVTTGNIRVPKSSQQTLIFNARAAAKDSHLLLLPMTICANTAAKDVNKRTAQVRFVCWYDGPQERVLLIGTNNGLYCSFLKYVLLSAKCQENCEFDWLLGARGQFKFVPVVTWTLYRFFYFVPMTYQAFYAKELPISPPDPITSPAILTPSPVLPPSLLFDPLDISFPEELLPRYETIFYTPTPPQIFEIGKCSTKMHLKHHEEQVEDILNYLEELSFHRIKKMEEGRINRMITQRNSNELKIELERVRSQIIKLQRKKLGQKDKIAFAHYRISNLEQIIKEIQARHQTNQEDL